MPSKRRYVTRDEMVRMAQSYDTAVSRAMCRALGVEMPRPRRGRTRYKRLAGAYEGLGECFENRRRVNA